MTKSVSPGRAAILPTLAPVAQANKIIVTNVLSLKEGLEPNLSDKAKARALSNDHLIGRKGLYGRTFDRALKKSE